MRIDRPRLLFVSALALGLAGVPAASLAQDYVRDGWYGGARGVFALRFAGPAGTLVARRPGTTGATEGITAAHNETAIITLPGARGHLVVAVFVKGVAGDGPARDRIIARIGQAAYDWAQSLRQYPTAPAITP